MIGNEHSARLALMHFTERRDDFVLSYSGTTRMVYLIDGVVYKVEFADDKGTNSSEYNNLQRIAAEATNVRVPKSNLFSIDSDEVIAMEYIDGQAVSECYCYEDEPHDNTCMVDDVKNIVSQFIFDIGGDNVIITNEGDIYIVDAAC